MKKVFYLAIAAIASLSIVSCSGNGNESATSSAAASAETTEATDQVKPEDANNLSCDLYTVAIPEGWTSSGGMVDNSGSIKYDSNPFTTASFGMNGEKEATIIEALKSNGFKPVDDITVAGQACKTLFKDGDDMAYRVLVPKDDSFLEIDVHPGGTSLKGDELKAIVDKNLQEIAGAVTLK